MDGTVWGSYPLGPPAGLRGGKLQNDAVDSEPVMLNHTRPMYTEEARANKVMGEMSLSILVGADGVVKAVKVRNGFLTALRGRRNAPS
ncbi:MAG: hypothetical protein DMF61_06805 [Blastocatellia bacterium AA13]|nr:MAG: hypothetical protein DMF61_06805 [Blastocatellia bacterium AA13]